MVDLIQDVARCNSPSLVRSKLGQFLAEFLGRTLFLAIVVILPSGCVREYSSVQLSEQKTEPAQGQSDTDQESPSTQTPNPVLNDVEVLMRYGHFVDALEIITQELQNNPNDEKFLELRTELFLLAGQPELAALSNAEHARALNRPTADGLVAGLLHEQANVRAAAIQALDVSQDPRRIDAVMPLAAVDESAVVRVVALRMLRKSPDERLKNTFLQLARDEAWIIRAEAVDALSSWNDIETRKALWAASDDEEQLVRHRARSSLRRMLDENNIEEYLRMASGNDPEIAFAAALALADRADQRATDALVLALQQDSDPMMRREAAATLAMLPPTEKALEALHESLQLNDSQLRAAVLDTLEKYRDPRSIGPLASFASDPLVPAVLSRRAFEIQQELRAVLAETAAIQQNSAEGQSESLDTTP